MEVIRLNIIIENLYVGDQRDGKNFHRLGPQPHVIIDLTGWAFDLDQNEENLDYVIKVSRIIHKCQQAEIPCLIHCHAGIDRAPFMVAAYLYVFKAYDPFEAYNKVKKERPQTIIHDDWLRRFIQFMKEDLSMKGE